MLLKRWKGKILAQYEVGDADFERLSNLLQAVETPVKAISEPIEFEEPLSKYGKLKQLTEKTWHDHLGVDGHVRTLDRQSAKTEHELQLAMQAFFIKMGQSVGDGIRQHTKSGAIIHESIVDHLIHDSEWTKEMAAVISPIMLKAGLSSALIEWNMHHPRKPHQHSASGLSTKMSAFGFSIKLPTSIISAVTHNVNKLVEKLRVSEIMDTVRGKIRRVISAVSGTSATPADVADKVVDSVFSPTEAHANAANISRTENSGAFNAGGKAAQDELGRLGLVNGRQWMTMRDDKVRKTHVAAGRSQPISLHEKFTVGKEQCEYPCDPNLSAGERINCRCYCVSVKVRRQI